MEMLNTGGTARVCITCQNEHWLILLSARNTANLLNGQGTGIIATYPYDE
jgi:hypothetical protein